LIASAYTLGLTVKAVFLKSPTRCKDKESITHFNLPFFRYVPGGCSPRKLQEIIHQPM
jgi:hypothetical protein